MHGGIATYGKDPETKGQYWDGKMYVFDERISVDVNQIDKTVIGKEHFDGTPCERYINCANPECNKQILVSEEMKKNIWVHVRMIVQNMSAIATLPVIILAMKNGNVV